MKRRIIGLLIVVFLISVFRLETYAKDIETKYQYDAVGRLIQVTYPDGSEIHYRYDNNGNIIETEKIVTTYNSEQEKNDEKEDEKEEISERIFRMMGFRQIDLSTVSLNIGDLHDTAQDKKFYKIFQKKRPVVKSIKNKQDKKRNYLYIKIKKIAGIKPYKELGYEVYYATNKKFKKAKKVTIEKGGSITNGKIKVAKKKQYWVKVRAYIKNKEGKTIYSKYSKVKKVNTKK